MQVVDQRRTNTAATGPTPQPPQGKRQPLPRKGQRPLACRAMQLPQNACAVRVCCVTHVCFEHLRECPLALLRYQPVLCARTAPACQHNAPTQAPTRMGCGTTTRRRRWQRTMHCGSLPPRATRSLLHVWLTALRLAAPAPPAACTSARSTRRVSTVTMTTSPSTPARSASRC